MDLGLRDRGCVITGASGAIGSATALALADEGARVLLIGRRQQALAKVQEQCEQRGASARTLALELTAADAAQRVATVGREGFGTIDVLVNCAGASAVRALAQLRDEDWQSQWELHVMAPMRLMRTLAPEMAQRGWGRIVNVCSSSGKRPSQALAMPYSVTKAAQLSLSRAFADLFASSGVLVNAVAPGPVQGELWLADGGLADQQARAQGSTREQVLAAARARLPRGRFGTPEEIAAVIAFLCSERAANVAGAAWSVDGGAVGVII
jgi:3-oxoacyl-[acyl-carrier protein] reductase